MALKILLFVIFLLTLWLRLKVIQLSTKLIYKKPRSNLFGANYPATLVTTLLTFAAYSFLTKTVYWPLLLLQLAAVTLGHTVQVLVSAYIGVDTSDKKNKFSAYEYLFMHRIVKRGRRWVLSFPQFVLGFGFLYGVFVFWKFPLGSPAASTFLLISIYLFPALANRLYIYSIQAYQMLLPEVDKDVRDFLLVISLSSTFQLIASFSIPFLFTRVYPDRFMFSSVSVTVLLIIPFLLFFGFILVPYFIGQNRLRTNTKNILEQYNFIISECLNAYYLPDINDKKREIEAIRHFIDNDEKIARIEIRYQEYLQLVQDEIPAQTDNTWTDNIYNHWQHSLSSTKWYFRNWDISFYYLKKIQELKSYLDIENYFHIESYLKYCHESSNFLFGERKANRTTLAIIIFTLLSGLLTYLVRVFEPQIITIIQNFYS